MSAPHGTPRWGDVLGFGALATGVIGGTVGTVLTESSWPGRFPLHLALFVATGLAWAAALVIVPRLRRWRGDLVAILVVAAIARVPAWLAAPVHSDDVYRYAWDGRVTRAGINPYDHAPADVELAPLRDGVRLEKPEFEREPARPTARRGPLWARINNPDLRTIYPPVAQVAFLVAAVLPLGPIASLKLVLALCELAVALALVRLLSRRGDDPRRALAWAWSPLVAVEIGQNAHVDALAILLLVLSLAAWHSRRWAWAGALLGLATATKLVTAPLLVTLRRGRAWLGFAVAITLAALPFATAGSAMLGSTGEFARRWRSNDGAYAVLQAATDRVVCKALGAPHVERQVPGPACDQPLDLWPHATLVRLVTGREHRFAIYPDELSSFAARALAALALLLAVAVTIRKRLDPVAGMEWILGALLLFTPALHPWYATWMLPLVALQRRAAWVALVALVPLGYAPLGAWLDGATWRDPLWTRLVEHGTVWSLLALAWWRSRRQLVGQDAGGAAPRDVGPPAHAG